MARLDHYIRPVALVDHRFYRVVANDPKTDFFHIYKRASSGNEPFRLQLVQEFSPKDFKKILEWLDQEFKDGKIDAFGWPLANDMQASEAIFRKFEIVSLPAAIAVWNELGWAICPSGDRRKIIDSNPVGMKTKVPAGASRRLPLSFMRKVPSSAYQISSSCS